MRGTTRNGLFDGFFFVALGMCFAFYEIENYIKKPFIFFIISMILLWIEVSTLENAGFIKSYDMFIWLVPVACFLFCLTIKLKLPDRPIYKTLRLLSSMIFYSHLLINWGVKKIFYMLYTPHTGSCIRFLITLPIIIIIDYLIIRLSNHQRFKWLKTIYT